MLESSLFIFHKDSMFRRMMLALTTQELKNKNKKNKILTRIQNLGMGSDDDEDNFYDTERAYDEALSPI